MQFGSMLVYCTVYDMCVCGGGHINIFSGGPQSSSYGPDMYDTAACDRDSRK